MKLFGKKSRSPDGAQLELLRENEREIRRSRLRIRALSLALALFLLIGLTAYASSAVVTKVRSFPIFFDRAGPAPAEISLSEDRDFSKPGIRLSAPVPDSLSCMSGQDIPEDIRDREGSQNGADYIAYSFYMKSGAEGALVEETIRIDFSSRHADKAIRVRVYRDGVPSTYAERDAQGLPEPGTLPFAGEGLVLKEKSLLEAGEVKKYTIVIWLEGDDPDCTDAVRGGSVRLSMAFAAEEPDVPGGDAPASQKTIKKGDKK